MPDKPESSLSPFGTARATIKDARVLSDDELKLYNRYMSACLYLCLGMIYLKENPLLKEPLKLEHLKSRLLGHWGSDSGQVFTYMHFNRLIKKYDLDAFFISGPGMFIVAAMTFTDPLPQATALLPSSPTATSRAPTPRYTPTSLKTLKVCNDSSSNSPSLEESALTPRPRRLDRCTKEESLDTR